MKTRICKWDNVKCLLIFSVVLGHFANQFAAESMKMKSLSIFIYSFHMPLFIFLSGLLQKRWDGEKKFDWNKPLFYIILGYTLKFAIYGIKLVFGKNPTFHWFGDTGLPWYMFAMAAFMVITYLLRKVNPKIVLPLWIAVACAAGYVESIGSFLYLSRILVFFPFYYMGYHLNGKDVMEFTDLKPIKALSVLVISVVGYISLFKIDRAYHYIRLLTGRNAYSLVHVSGGVGWQDRLLCYGLAICMGAAMISLVPNRKLPVAGYIGQNTLQIYFWHRLVLYVIMYVNVAKMLHSVVNDFWLHGILSIAIALTLVLSIKSFGKPIKFIKKKEQNFVMTIASAL
ncbi:MAG: acyltransferase family protein [Lachnospiraceae bacterium]|nr:acyltransferase family protein [Lachnospiraceae bacterium]